MVRHTNKQHGFTLIEMIVSLGLFSIVVSVAVGALLMLVSTNQRLQGEQSVMTNLAFALDSMTREIRVGSYYYCDSQSTENGSTNIFNSDNDLDTVLQATSYRDCSQGNSGNTRLHGVAFLEGGNSITAGDERILYFFDNTDKTIYRRVGAEAKQSVVSSAINIERVDFFVTGTKSVSVGGGSVTDQPSVTIYVEATEANDPGGKVYSMQTTVTQRTLDL